MSPLLSTQYLGQPEKRNSQIKGTRCFGGSLELVFEKRL